MWLPKDQRKLLAFYYSKIGESSNTLDLDKPTLIASMKVIKSDINKETDLGEELEIMKSPIYRKAKDANKYLVGREFIKIYGSGNGATQAATGGVVYKMKCVELTIEGADLGRRYNSWFTLWGLWLEEHKVNPVWTILRYITTALVGYVIGRLT